MAIAVVDPDGTLKAFSRMDGAALLAVRIAQQKAWTAISFGLPTLGLWEFIKEDPPLLHSLPHQEDMILFGGGSPINVDGKMIGGIGVSGGHYSQDQECADAGLAALGTGDTPESALARIRRVRPFINPTRPQVDILDEFAAAWQAGQNGAPCPG